MLALINDVLDISKIESGRLELRREHFLVQDALDETISSLRPRAANKMILVKSSVPKELNIYADRLRFKQVLYNPLGNALKFTSEGGHV